MKKYPKPKYEGEILKNIDCDICGNPHQKLKAIKIDYHSKDILVWQVKSPCLNKISKDASNLMNKMIKPDVIEGET